MDAKNPRITMLPSNFDCPDNPNRFEPIPLPARLIRAFTGDPPGSGSIEASCTKGGHFGSLTAHLIGVSLLALAAFEPPTDPRRECRQGPSEKNQF
jgi:hypothetical protein